MTRRRLRTGYRRDGGVDLRRLPNIVQRPLGKEQAYGFAAQLLHGDAGEPPFEGPPTIWLDPSYDGTRRGLEVALHEALHLACPWMYEQVVTQTARYQAMLLWHLGYRLTHKDERQPD